MEADLQQLPLRVAVVVPVFNGERFLAETLASIRAQSRSADEIIVINDCSTDRSSAIARTFGATVIDLEHTAGPSGARNRGIHATTADVIALCDADDVWFEDHLASVVGLLERFPEAGMAFSRVVSFGAADHEQERLLPANVPSRVYWEQYHENIVIPSSAVIRKSVWSDVGHFDESPLIIGCEDWEFVLRVAARHALVCAEQVTVRYRKHPAQLTSSSKPRIRRAEYSVRERLLADAKQHASPEFVSRMERAFLATWEWRLREAWNDRSWFWLQLYLALHRVVPDAGPTFRKWRLKSALLPVAWCADRLRMMNLGGTAELTAEQQN
jgi:glycosyltransferase involved in cell wall biosynthesis